MPMLNVDGVSIYYRVIGEGVPIIFIHPPLITSTIFTYQVAELSKHFKMITFDIRGHGKSHYSNQAVTYPLIADDIHQLLDHLEIKQSYICGYSTGGSVALEFLLRYPQQAFGGMIISGMSEITDWYQKCRIFIGKTLSKPSTLQLLSFAISFGNANKKEVYQQLHNEALKGYSKNIEQYYQYSLDYNCTDQLHKIHHPILLIYGGKDKAFHRYARLLHEKLPRNEFKMLENEKHQIPTKASVELNKVILQFIKNR
ncbi:MAG TPA: alpha/beta hydrolase [Bacillales bacterium]|nr:alpha/beta hydrolase [Bacillales bacterium]